jgi:hypothetical protein
MIFVQIVAYRDPELLPTIVDCLAKAKYRKQITFGICWQRHPSEHYLDGIRGRKAFRIDEVDCRESRGLGWARSRVQQLYNHEEFTLQLDSHHRFLENWDHYLMQACELTGSAKPIVTTYAGVYDPKSNERNQAAPYKMVADRFTDAGTILFRPHEIPDSEQLVAPIPARFVSGHFFFTLGKHCAEYQYDPSLYFAGDEISLSIRSYTLGYDLFHPHRTVIWHEYSRNGRVKHWDDHVRSASSEGTSCWYERDELSKRRLRQLLREEDTGIELGQYGLGTARSYRDYEIYSGIDFGRRRLHIDTLSGVNPPCVYTNEEQWERGFTLKNTLTLRWNPKDIEWCDDLQFIYYGVEDARGNVVYRYDAPADSLEARMLIDRRDVTFRAVEPPTTLIMWPYSRTRGWLRKVVYEL